MQNENVKGLLLLESWVQEDPGRRCYDVNFGGHSLNWVRGGFSVGVWVVGQHNLRRYEGMTLLIAAEKAIARFGND